MLLPKELLRRDYLPFLHCIIHTRIVEYDEAKKFDEKTFEKATRNVRRSKRLQGLSESSTYFTKLGVDVENEFEDYSAKFIITFDAMAKIHIFGLCVSSNQTLVLRMVDGIEMYGILC
jgi:hypothetical protein